MDQFQPSGNPYGQPYFNPYRSNHSEQMAIASMTLGMIALALMQYGSIDGILKAYSDMSGLDYNDLIRQLYQTP